jgi:hypothetical protein
MSCAATCTTFFSAVSTHCEESLCLAINRTCFAVSNLSKMPYPLCSDVCCTSTNILRVAFVGVLAALGLALAAVIALFCIRNNAATLRRESLVVSPLSARRANLYTRGSSPSNAQDIDLNEIVSEDALSAKATAGAHDSDFIVDHRYSGPRSSFFHDAAEDIEVETLTDQSEGKTAAAPAADSSVRPSTQRASSLDAAGFRTSVPPPAAPSAAPLGFVADSRQHATPQKLSPLWSDRPTLSPVPPPSAPVDIDVDEVAGDVKQQEELSAREQAEVLGALGLRDGGDSPAPPAIEIEGSEYRTPRPRADPTSRRGNSSGPQQGRQDLLTAAPYRGPPAVTNPSSRHQPQFGGDIEFDVEDEHRDDDQVSIQFSVEIAPTPRSDFIVSPRPADVPVVDDVELDELM